MEVSYDKNSLIVDGKRVFIRSGAFHYFRTPGVELAKDRFLKMKAGGYNTVDIYFNANYHSEKDGVYDFSGIKDVRAVLNVAKDVGLFVIECPGPFINGEVNAGGIPFWLLNKKGVIPRNRIGSSYHYSPEYMEFVNQWYDTIIPIINEFDNVILFQIENEYATDEMEEDYMRELYSMARNRGIKCPISHNDAFHAGLWADVVDIYADDIYPYINPNQNWKADNFCFDSLDNVEDTFRCFKENAPIYIAEMQGGWFDKWDGIGYPKMREALGDEHINIVTKTAISQGVTIFNHYMGAGGTSWGNLACDEVYTSYDFTAGIDEYGNVQPNFYKAKAINYFLDSFGFTNTDNREPLDFGEGIYAVKRKDFENDCDWIFVRNLNSDIANLNISGFNFELKPYDMKIIPQHLKLYGCELEFSDVEIFARLKNDNEEVIFMIADKNTNLFLNVNGEKVIVSGDKKDYENLRFEGDGKVTQFVFISKELSDRSWLIDKKMIFNADFVYSNGRIAISKTTEIAYFDIDNGFSKKYFKYTQNQPKSIKLNDFDVNFCAPEIDAGYDCSSWKKITKPFDAFTAGMYDEFIWYKAKLPKGLEEITISAMHIFSVYVNGKEVLNRNSYKYEKLQQIPETISVKLGEKVLTKEVNELTIFVQNLGFDKGFSGDTNNPRGLVEFATKPEKNIQFYVNQKMSFERDKNALESDSPYLAKLSAKFNVEQKENVVKTLNLSLKDFKYDRATIFLNGIKIGRYLKNNQNCSLQEDFYLINTFLKEENTMDIVIWERQSHIKTPWDFKNELKHVIISIDERTVHQLY